jgi:predicted helicase
MHKNPPRSHEPNRQVLRLRSYTSLGNRSALEWVIDQYRVSTDMRSGIVNDPNRADDPEYIVRLIGQVVTVSLETVRLVRELSALPLLNPGD